MWGMVFLAGGSLGWVWTFNEDLGFQLNAARYLWQQGDVPRTEPFLYSEPGVRYVNLQWLWQLGIYAAHSGLGLEGATLVNLILQALAGGVFLWRWRNLRDGALPGAGVAGVLLWYFMSTPVGIRPHSLSWVWLGLVLLCLESARKGDRRGAWGLPACLAGWVNCHALFSLGLVTTALFAGTAWARDAWVKGLQEAWKKNRLLLGAAVACLPVSFLNPYGWEGVWFPLRQADLVFSPSLVKETIQELQPLFGGTFWETPLAGFPVIHVKKITMAFLYVFLLVGAWRARRRIPAPAWAVGVALALLPLSATKNFGYFFMAFGPYALLGWKRFPGARPAAVRPWASWAVAGAAGLVILAVVTGRWDSFFQSPLFGSGLDSGIHPTGAGKLLARLPGEVVVVNGHNQGGWLAWSSGRRVFIDSRNDIYSRGLYELARGAEGSPAAFLELLEGTRADAVFCSVKDQPMWIWVLSTPAGPDGWKSVVGVRWQGPDWRPVWMDAKGVLFLREGFAPECVAVTPDEPGFLRWREAGPKTREILRAQAEKPFPWWRLFFSGVRSYPTDLNRLVARSSALRQGEALKGFALSGLEESPWFYPMIWMNLALWLEQEGDFPLADDCWAVLERRVGDPRIRAQAEEFRRQRKL
jgi:hypothetical protein